MDRYEVMAGKMAPLTDGAHRKWGFTGKVETGSLSALAVSVAGAMMHGEKKSPPSLSQAGGFLVEVQLAKANGAPTPRR